MVVTLCTLLTAGSGEKYDCYAKVMSRRSESLIRAGKAIPCNTISSILESRFSNFYGNLEWLLTVRTCR